MIDCFAATGSEASEVKVVFCLMKFEGSVEGTTDPNVVLEEQTVS